MRYKQGEICIVLFEQSISATLRQVYFDKKEKVYSVSSEEYEIFNLVQTDEGKEAHT